MIDIGERSRRMILFLEALWEARERICGRVERKIDQGELDWFELEEVEEYMDFERYLRRLREEFDLGAAYDSQAVHVTCTRRERSEALRLAFDVLEGRLTPERGVERLLSKRFPDGVSDP